MMKMKLFISLVYLIYSIELVRSETNPHRYLEYPIKYCVKSISTGHHDSCLYQVFQSFFKFHNWSDEEPFTFCGNLCSISLKGRISNWKWIWDARFRCQNKAPGIEGLASRLSRPGATEWAINDFVANALATGRFNSNEFEC